jgi:hypothetical protein
MKESVEAAKLAHGDESKLPIVAADYEVNRSVKIVSAIASSISADW